MQHFRQQEVDKHIITRCSQLTHAIISVTTHSAAAAASRLRRCIIRRPTDDIAGVEPPPSALNVTLPAFAADSRRLHRWVHCSTASAAIDRYLLPAGCSVANQPAAVAAVNRWYRQTDAR